MKYSPRYRALPTSRHRGLMGWQLNTLRQLYNHGLKRFNEIPEDAGTVKQRVRMVRDELPDLKQWWPGLSGIYSKVSQLAIERIAKAITSLRGLKDAGYKVGSLNWKKPREYRSFTYQQSGFELDKKSGRTGRAVLTLKKVKGETIEVPIRWHRDLPEDAAIKSVTLKREPTGAWCASFTIEVDTPEKPAVEDIDADDCVGLDLGVLNYVHDSNGVSVGRLDLSDERERLEREQRSLSRKQYESNNWDAQRQRVAEVHAEMINKNQDFKHKLAHHYTTQFDAVFLEDLNVKGMIEGDSNARNKAEVGWRDLISIFEHHGRKNGCHVLTVEPENTTLECASCGSSVYKPLWVREHSCPTCGFETDRDWNAALNVLSKGLDKIGVVHSEDTPVETATAVSIHSVDASRVVEAGSPCLKERTASAVSE